MNPYTSFLYARPSFLEGIARTLDMGATLQHYNSSVLPQHADALALSMDWRAVGTDFLQVMEELSEEEEIALSRELMEQAQAALNPAAQLEISDAR